MLYSLYAWDIVEFCSLTTTVKIAVPVISRKIKHGFFADLKNIHMLIQIVRIAKN